MGVEVLEYTSVSAGSPLTLTGLPPLTSALLTIGNTDGTLPIDAASMTVSNGGTTISYPLTALPGAGNYPVHILPVPVSGELQPINFTLDYGAGTSLTGTPADPPSVGALRNYQAAALIDGVATDEDALVEMLIGSRTAAGWKVTATGGTFTVASKSASLTAADETDVSSALSSMTVDSISAASSHSVYLEVDTAELSGFYELVALLTMDDGQIVCARQTLWIINP